MERRHDVLALTLAGHAGGPPVEGEISDAMLADAVERAMGDAGFEIAHMVGNSLGGYVSLQLASRGRAETVVALAPAGGWAPRRRVVQGHAQLPVDDARPDEGRSAACRGGPGLPGGPAPRDTCSR
jgi:pimeloyl-ACP methyl ester carboxylesterase